MNKILSILIFVIISHQALGQHSDVSKSRVSLTSLQDSLQRLSQIFINNESEPERYNANYTFIKSLVNALKTPRSFNFNFDSLKTISIQTAQDKRFRIFTWHIMNNDGSYRYYGTVQMNNPDGKLVMFPLVDYSPAIKNPADSVTTNDKWYGAQYYKIIPVTYNVRVPYYILLGWKGSTPKSTKKVIDIIYFKDNKAFFGMPVFDGDKEKPNKKRIIFEYTRQVSMLLNFDPKANLIVFDHLAPPDPKLKGNFESYGPDMSYDAYKLTNGRWKLVEDIAMKNPPSENDDKFNDPKKLKGSVAP
jgi:hypothetical protein